MTVDNVLIFIIMCFCVFCECVFIVYLIMLLEATIYYNYVIIIKIIMKMFPWFQNQNSLSEIEKREKRAMERKLSEMEEELKVMKND